MCIEIKHKNYLHFNKFHLYSVESSEEMDDYSSIQHKIQNVIVTVPASYNSCQCQTIERYAKLFGFNVLKLLRKPIAAIMAYIAYDSGINYRIYKQNYLVYDLEKEYFNVSIVRFENYKYNVIKTIDDETISGNAINNLLVKYFTNVLKKHHNLDVNADDKLLECLQKNCDRVKNTLTIIPSAKVKVNDIEMDINIKLFEFISNDLLLQTLVKISELLKRTHLIKHDIARVILIGECCNISKIPQMLEEYFNSKICKITISPSEVISHGVTFQKDTLHLENYVFTQLQTNSFLDAMTLIDTKFKLEEYQSKYFKSNFSSVPSLSASVVTINSNETN